MNIICLEIRNRDKTSFLYYDTDNKVIKTDDYNYVSQHVEDFYGIKLQNNRINYIGYNYLALSVNNKIIAYNNCYVVVAKFIENRQKYYLLVRSDGIKMKCTEKNTLLLIENNRIMNTVHSDKIVKLKIGSIPVYTANRNKTIENKNDTVTKLYEIRDTRARVHTPGVGRKFLGKRKKDNKVGIVKYTVTKNAYDNINEVACYYLGKLFGVSVCEASFEIYNGNSGWVMSLYDYDYNNKTLLRCKDIFGTENFHKRFSIKSLRDMFGQDVVDDFNKMVIFDLITHQVDRHIGNFAFIDNKMYPLYDNGRSLFWDIDNLKKLPVEDIVNTFYTNEHGFGWAYVDGILGITECRKLINKVSYLEIFNILNKFYNEDRAKALSNYVYNTYKIITGNR